MVIVGRNGHGDVIPKSWTRLMAFSMPLTHLGNV